MCIIRFDFQIIILTIFLDVILLFVPLYLFDCVIPISFKSLKNDYICLYRYLHEIKKQKNYYGFLSNIIYLVLIFIKSIFGLIFLLLMLFLIIINVYSIFKLSMCIFLIISYWID